MQSSRRKVLKSLGIVAGISAAGLLPKVVMGSTARPSIETSSVLGKKGVDAILLGAGKRGRRFSKFSAIAPQDFRIVAVAEPIADRNQTVATQLGLATPHQFADWKNVFEYPKFADVVVIAASGNYMEPCAAALRAGYDVWVDRSVSLEAAEMDQINALARKLGRQLLFCYGYPKNLRFMDHALLGLPV